MQKASRQFLNEILWIIFCLLLTLLLALLFFGKTLLKHELDLHLHDTYFVVLRWLVLTPLLVLVTFIIYFIKSGTRKFSTAGSYWILVLCGLTLIVLLSYFISTLSQSAIGGWTSYPPLSALLPDQVPEEKPDPLLTAVVKFFMILQFIITSMTLYAAYRWGTRNRKENQT